LRRRARKGNWDAALPCTSICAFLQTGETPARPGAEETKGPERKDTGEREGAHTLKKVTKTTSELEETKEGSFEYRERVDSSWLLKRRETTESAPMPGIKGNMIAKGGQSLAQQGRGSFEKSSIGRATGTDAAW